MKNNKIIIIKLSNFSKVIINSFYLFCRQLKKTVKFK